MADIIGLTATEQVRAVMGVSDRDLPDTSFTDFAVEDDLAVDLDGWVAIYPNLLSGSGHGLDSAVAEKLLKRLKLYCKYFVGYLMFGNAESYLLQKISDGDNEGQRFKDMDFDAARTRLMNTAMEHKVVIVAELEQKDADTQTYSPFALATPSYDPVIGE